MAKGETITELVKRLSGPRKGKEYVRYFRSEAQKTAVLSRYRRKAHVPKKKRKLSVG